MTHHSLSLETDALNTSQVSVLAWELKPEWSYYVKTKSNTIAAVLDSKLFANHRIHFHFIKIYSTVMYSIRDLIVWIQDTVLLILSPLH